MSKKKKRTRAEPATAGAYLCNMANYEIICGSGYTRLSENPEIMSAVNKIADLVSNMTIHLMQNTTNGDVRIVNALSRKIDINPSRYMTRKAFMAALVRVLLLEGDGNAVIAPMTRDGLIDDLVIAPPSKVSLMPDGYGYKIIFAGQEFDPQEMIHVVVNPDPEYPWKGCGYRQTLKGVAKTLKQAADTKDGFMKSKWQPSLVVKVDAMTEEFANKEGREKLLESFIKNSEAGEPWMIPAEQFEVQQVKPLSLKDIALPESVQMDKRTVASILDVPPFLVGEGEFKESEWNNFVNTKIRAVCTAIVQAFTKTLLISPDYYFKFSVRSIYAYDIEKLSRVGDDNFTRGIMTGNEVRDWLGLSPKDGLDELIILENYIPQGMIGNQKKLIQGGED